MTELDGFKFIKNCLQANWPKWDFSEENKAEWVKRLWKYDYYAAVKAVNNLAFTSTKQGIPPAGAIFKALQGATEGKGITQQEPVSVYQIMRPDGRRTGFPVALPRTPTEDDLHALRIEAEQIRDRVAGGRATIRQRYKKEKGE